MILIWIRVWKPLNYKGKVKECLRDIGLGENFKKIFMEKEKRK